MQLFFLFVLAETMDAFLRAAAVVERVCGLSDYLKIMASAAEAGNFTACDLHIGNNSGKLKSAGFTFENFSAHKTPRKTLYTLIIHDFTDISTVLSFMRQ